METLNKFLENLKPGGASNLPKSKFEQTLTDDSEVDSPEPQEQTIKTDVNKPIGEPNTKKEMPQKPRKGLVKQMADVRQESLENEEICNNKLMKTEEIKQVPPNPLPRKKKIPKINEPENESVEKLWQDLNVGKNGFLTISELEKVCNYLGMNTPDQKSLKSLFAIIDTDSDGRVSLAEFSAGLKKYGNVQNLEISNLNLSSSSISGLFSCIDPNKQGFCEAQRVVELWASGGILNGNEVLDYLEFSMNKPVNLIALSKALEQEIINENLDAITLTGIITYQKELYYCRNRQVEDSRASLMGHQQTSNSSLLQKSGELQNNLDKLTEELSYITYENESLKEHVKELEEINRHQIEELDAVADLHRKMDLELKLYRDNKNQNSQAFQNDKETERSLFLSNNTIKNLEKDLLLRIHECEILTVRFLNELLNERYKTKIKKQF